MDEINIKKIILEKKTKYLKKLNRECEKNKDQLVCEKYKNIGLETRNLINEIKVLTKEKLYYELPFYSGREMHLLIIKNIKYLPTLEKSIINDHTVAVLLNAIKVTYLSLKDKPFGWGINNYQSAFNKYMLKDITPYFPEIYYLNYNDASNNFIKMIVEFGVFSILIFINLIIFTLNKKVSISRRILISGVIATQMARAAGYFNGGFILCLIITFILNYRTIIQNEK